MVNVQCVIFLVRLDLHDAVFARTQFGKETSKLYFLVIWCGLLSDIFDHDALVPKKERKKEKIASASLPDLIWKRGWYFNNSAKEYQVQIQNLSSKWWNTMRFISGAGLEYIVRFSCYRYNCFGQMWTLTRLKSHNCCENELWDLYATNYELSPSVWFWTSSGYLLVRKIVCARSALLFQLTQHIYKLVVAYFLKPDWVPHWVLHLVSDFIRWTFPAFYTFCHHHTLPNSTYDVW